MGLTLDAYKNKYTAEKKDKKNIKKESIKCKNEVEQLALTLHKTLTESCQQTETLNIL